MRDCISFVLNGRLETLRNVPPATTLLNYLRKTKRLTGTKEGCAEGDCGACSVAIIDRDARGKRCYRAINSCLVPLPLMAGRDIVTVEGVACGKAPTFMPMRVTDLRPFPPATCDRRHAA